MAVPDKSIDPILLQCAKEEFLKCGYDKASTNVICKNAHVTTGALFKRFASKEALFYGVVGDSIDELKNWFLAELEAFNALDVPGQLECYKQKPYHVQVLDIIYDHYDDFKIIIDRSSLSQYSDFLDFFVEIETEFVVRFLQRVNPQAFGSKMVCEEVIHIINSAFYNGVFEVVRHNLNKEDALECMEQLHNFYSKGWDSIINGDLSIK